MALTAAVVACSSDGADQEADDTTSTSAAADPTTSSTVVATGDPAVTTEQYDCTIPASELAGEAPTYRESIEGDSRVISTNSVPDHDVAEFPLASTDPPADETALAAIDYTLIVPLTPSGEGTATGGAVPVGILFSGAWVHSEAGVTFDNSPDSDYRVDVKQLGAFGADLGVDCEWGHPFPLDPADGQYHYHALPDGLLSGEEEVQQLGWAADGYPVMGPYGSADPDDPDSSAVLLTDSFQLREGARDGGPGGEFDGTYTSDYEYVEGSGDLDECNGRSETVTTDDGDYDYAYHLTDTYPYVPPCLQAEIVDDDWLIIPTGGPAAPGDDTALATTEEHCHPVVSGGPSVCH